MTRSTRDGDDRSGWESAAGWFVEYAARSRVGVGVVEAWARDLPPGGAVLDVGCGPGSPRTVPLAGGGRQLYAIDSSPSLAAAYRRRFPDAHVECEAVERSSFFGRAFAGILAWGLVFLLPSDEQRSVLRRLVAALEPGGRLLFTAPSTACTWSDRTTGQPSASLGAEAYRALMESLGATLEAEFDDEGQNHYYDVRKRSG